MANIHRTKEGVPYISSETLAGWAGAKHHEFVRPMINRGVLGLNGGAWIVPTKHRGQTAKVIHMTREAGETLLQTKRPSVRAKLIEKMTKAFQEEAERRARKADAPPGNRRYGLVDMAKPKEEIPPSFNADGFIAKLRADGFTLELEGGTLFVSPSDRLTDTQRLFIRQHKPAIVAALTRASEPSDMDRAAEKVRVAVEALDSAIANPEPVQAEPAAVPNRDLLSEIRASGVEPRLAVRCAGSADAVQSARAKFGPVEPEILAALIAERDLKSKPEPAALPAVVPREWNGEPMQTVDARELHAWLEVGRDFTTWIKDRIREYGFAEGRDYLLTKTGEQVPHQGGFRTVQKDAYHITTDMAKELSMVERNEKGKEARAYFIRCEKQLKTLDKPKAKESPRDLAAVPETFKLIAELLSGMVGLPRSQAILGADRATVALCGGSLLKMAGVAESVRAECQEPLMTPTEIGRVFQMTARAVNLLLEKLGLQYKHDTEDGPQWALTAHGVDLGGEVQVVNVPGKKTTVTQIKWARSILQYLQDQLAMEGV